MVLRDSEEFPGLSKLVQSHLESSKVGPTWPKVIQFQLRCSGVVQVVFDYSKIVQSGLGLYKVGLYI